MRKTLSWLQDRRRRNAAAPPSLFVIQYFIVALNLTLMAFLVLDGPAAAGADSISAYVRDIGLLITDIGRAPYLMLASALVFTWAMVSRRRLRDITARTRKLHIAHAAAYVFASVSIASLTANIAKQLIGRARPPQFGDWGTFGFSPLSGDFLFQSFPSAHSTNFGALFMALALLFPRYRLLFVLAAIWLAMTRVMINVHYPSDVIGGLAWGSWCALAIAAVFSRYRLVFATGDAALPRPRFKLP